MGLRASALAGLLAWTLAACGGGGNGDTASSTNTTPPASNGGNKAGGSSVTDVVASAGTLKTTAAATTYGSSSQQQSFFAAMNQARAAAGAGVVDQSALIDTASQAHAAYLTTNIAVVGLTHFEDSTKAGYYAYGPTDRLTKAGVGYSFSTEVIGGTGPSLLASGCVYGLLNTVYHGAALLSQETSVGIGMGSDASGVPLCVADVADASGDTYGQVPAAGALIAYPYDTQPNVLETFYVAYESPRPPTTLFPNTTAGSPVLVRVRNADFVNDAAAGTLAVTVTQFELHDASGNLVPAGILANPSITGGSGVTLNADGNLAEGFAVLVPLSPLAKGQTYTARFTATLKAGGSPLTKTWSFTTNP